LRQDKQRKASGHHAEEHGAADNRHYDFPFNSHGLSVAAQRPA
jgi:hypothetical protein